MVESRQSRVVSRQLLARYAARNENLYSLLLAV